MSEQSLGMQRTVLTLRNQRLSFETVLARRQGGGFGERAVDAKIRMDEALTGFENLGNSGFSGMKDTRDRQR